MRGYGEDAGLFVFPVAAVIFHFVPLQIIFETIFLLAIYFRLIYHIEYV